MSGENFVRIPLKRPFVFKNQLNIEPPTKSVPISKAIFPTIESKKKVIEPKEKIDRHLKRHSNHLKINGETYKVGDCAFFTQNKYIGRIDSISFPIDESQPVTLETTWCILLYNH